MKPDLRHALRQKTHTNHDQLDRSVSMLDIAQLSGFTTFLQLHFSCFLAMQSRLSDTCASSLILAQMISGLKDDLDAISADCSATKAALPVTLDPLSIDYMVAGSRLGTKVLHKTWARSDDPIVQRADGYFGQDSDPALWRETCSALAEVPVDSPRAAVIVADTQHLFQLFMTVFDDMVMDQDALV